MRYLRLNAALGAIPTIGNIYYYGGSGADRLRAVQADADGAWLVGWSLSKDLPVSAQAAQRSHNGQGDGWLLRPEKWTPSVGQ